MGVGGAERLVVSLARGLRERGHAVAVSGAAGPLDDDLEGLGVERVRHADRSRAPAGVARMAGLLARDLRRWRPSVVHAQNVRMTAVAAAATRLARGPRRAPVLASSHGVAPAEAARAARVLRAADAVACVSAELAADLRAHGHAPERTPVVPNAAPPPVRLSEA